MSRNSYLVRAYDMGHHHGEVQRETTTQIRPRLETNIDLEDLIWKTRSGQSAFYFDETYRQSMEGAFLLGIEHGFYGAEKAGGVWLHYEFQE